MSMDILTQGLLLPDLCFVKKEQKDRDFFIYCDKVSGFEVCPHCAGKCFSVYDHVTVIIKDEPIRNRHVYLKIKKRFHCKPCNKIFREPVGGVYKGFRTGQRFRCYIRMLASECHNLKQVTKKAQHSNWLVYTDFINNLAGPTYSLCQILLKIYTVINSLPEFLN